MSFSIRRFGSWRLPLLQLFQGKTAVAASPEFLQWRHQFLLQRLTLLSWVMLGILCVFGILLFKVAIPSLNATADPELMIDPERLLWTIQVIAAQGLGLLLTLVLLQHPPSRNYPERLFLLLAGMAVLLPQIISTFFGEATLDDSEWILFFSTQAILIPVCWQLHLLSQLSVLGLFTLKAVVFGLRDSRVSLPLAYLSAATYTLMVCAIADGGVYLYERALRREFELRQQVQVFLHAVSHDLRNPILGTLMTLKALRSPGTTLSLPDDVVVQMIESGDRQIQLINALLEAHATETAGVQLRPHPTPLNPLVQSVLVDFHPFIDSAQAQVTLAIAVDLPPIQADPLQLRRVYENLISNALKYNPPGLRLTITAEVMQLKPERQRVKQLERFRNLSTLQNASSGMGWIRCTVSDDGTGMTQQQCDRLFDLYTRGSNARQTLGLGLGLYICRQIVIAHGGDMGVISQLGQGTTFWFTLPLAIA